MATKKPFLVLQICLPSHEDIKDFRQTISEYAAKNRLETDDLSAVAQRVSDSFETKPKQPGIMDIHVNWNSKYFIFIDNQGIPSNQPVLSFFDTGDFYPVRDAANRLKEELARRWKVRIETSDGSPLMNDCPAVQDRPPPQMKP